MPKGKNHYKIFKTMNEFREVFDANENDLNLEKCKQVASANIVATSKKSNKTESISKTNTATNCKDLKDKANLSIKLNIGNPGTLQNTKEDIEGQKSFIQALNLVSVDGSEQTSSNHEGYTNNVVTSTISNTINSILKAIPAAEDNYIPQSVNNNMEVKADSSSKSKADNSRISQNTDEVMEGQKEFMNAINLVSVDGFDQTSLSSEGFTVRKTIKTYSRRLKIRKDDNDDMKTDRNQGNIKNLEKKFNLFDEDDLVSGVQSRVKASYESRKRKRAMPPCVENNEIAISKLQLIEAADNSNVDFNEEVDADSVHWGDYLMEKFFKSKQKSPEKKNSSSVASTFGHKSKKHQENSQLKKRIKGLSFKSKKSTLALTKLKKVRKNIKKRFQSVPMTKERTKTIQTDPINKSESEFNQISTIQTDPVNKYESDFNPIFSASQMLWNLSYNLDHNRSTVLDADEIDEFRHFKNRPKFNCSYCCFESNLVSNMLMHTGACTFKPLYRALPSDFTDLEMEQSIRGNDSAVETDRTMASIGSETQNSEDSCEGESFITEKFDKFRTSDASEGSTSDSEPKSGPSGITSYVPEEDDDNINSNKNAKDDNINFNVNAKENDENINSNVNAKDDDYINSNVNNKDDDDSVNSNLNVKDDEDSINSNVNTTDDEETMISNDLHDTGAQGPS